MKRLRKKRKPLFFIVIFMILFLLLGGTFTWYLLSWKKQEADRDNIEVMTPYFLYLLNPGDHNSLQFSIGNIHPGEVKRVVICVSNQKPKDSSDTGIEIAKESDFNYDLEFIYTENLALDYKVYELSKKNVEDNQNVPENGIIIEGINDFYWTKKGKSTESENETENGSPLNGENVSNSRWEEVFKKTDESIDFAEIENKGQYLLFQKDVNGNFLHLSYLADIYEYDYYLIEMSWKENANFSDNAKETDLLYVVVNAKQPKPQQ